MKAEDPSAIPRVGKAGAFRSLYLADKVTDAKAALNDVTKTLQDLGV